jgi:N-acetylated-alpha-linked acidic dipeptidase
VRFAELYGAKAALIYGDPMNSAPIITNEETYPNGDFLPPDGTQRGSIFTGSGDPLTPDGYPSTEYAYRIDEKKANLPNIPAQVIGYR